MKINICSFPLVFFHPVMKHLKSLDSKIVCHSGSSASKLFTVITQGHLNTFCMRNLKLKVPFYIFIKLLINMLYCSFYWVLSYIQNATWIQAAFCINEIKCMQWSLSTIQKKWRSSLNAAHIRNPYFK